MYYSSHNRLQYWASVTGWMKRGGASVRRSGAGLSPQTYQFDLRPFHVKLALKTRVSVPAMAVPCQCHTTNSAPPTFLHS